MYVTMNMYSNAQCNVAYFAVGGHLNIYDNAINIVTAGVFVGPPNSGFWGEGGPSDATRQINMAGGTLYHAYGERR